MNPIDPMAFGPRRRILVTGAAGYVGGALVRDLLALGHEVVAVDTMVFGERALAALHRHPALTVRRMDVRGLQREHLTGIHAIVDLAGIGSPLAARLDPAWTNAVNHVARVRLAQLAHLSGVQRYILASSCCVYADGASDGPHAPCSESSPSLGLAPYAAANLKAESGVLPLARPGFAPTVLRLATCWGLAPRTRFDIIVNAMAEQALRERRIDLPDDGTAMHRLVHVNDATRAIVTVLGAPLGSIGRQIFNVGADHLSSWDIARTVRRVLGSHVLIQPGMNTNNLPTASPAVAFDKLTRQLGWLPDRDWAQGVAELLDALDRGHIQADLTTLTDNWYRTALLCPTQVVLRNAVDEEHFDGFANAQPVTAPCKLIPNTPRSRGRDLPILRAQSIS